MRAPASRRAKRCANLANLFFVDARRVALSEMKRLLNPELYVLTAASALTHFWRLFTPNAVVWDEIYYKRFAGHYFDHTFYFDPHPPLANLLFAAVARIAGVPAATLLSDAPAPGLRVLPALCGTLLVPLG